MFSVDLLGCMVDQHVMEFNKLQSIVMVECKMEVKWKRKGITVMNDLTYKLNQWKIIIKFCAFFISLKFINHARKLLWYIYFLIRTIEQMQLFFKWLKASLCSRWSIIINWFIRIYRRLNAIEFNKLQSIVMVEYKLGVKWKRKWPTAMHEFIYKLNKQIITQVNSCFCAKVF